MPSHHETVACYKSIGLLPLRGQRWIWSRLSLFGFNAALKIGSTRYLLYVNASFAHIFALS